MQSRHFIDIFMHVGDFRRRAHSNAGFNIDAIPVSDGDRCCRRNKAACRRVAPRTSAESALKQRVDERCIAVPLVHQSGHQQGENYKD
jgi:hypothetical protein